MDSVLQLDHTNDSVFLFFYSFTCVYHLKWLYATFFFLGIFVEIGKTSWLCLVSVNLLLFILKNTPVN